MAPGGFDKLALLRGVADCGLDRFRDFDLRAHALRDAARAFAGARNEATLAALRQAWLTTMASWGGGRALSHRALGELQRFRVGRTCAITIDAWPLISRCKIEEQLVSKAYENANFGTSLVNGRGARRHRVPRVLHGHRQRVREHLGDQHERLVGRAESAGSRAAGRPTTHGAAAEDVVNHADLLNTAWEPAGGNFHGELGTAGAGSQIYKRDTDALNAVTVALFYVEVEVKDLKLARPLGFDQCTKARCPELVESPLRARIDGTSQGQPHRVPPHLRGLRRRRGGDRLRRLAARGGRRRARRQHDRGALTATRAQLDALDPPLETAVEGNASEVEALYTTMKGLTTPLKTPVHQRPRSRAAEDHRRRQ